VDVREAGEFEAARLPGFSLLPLSLSEEWSQDITQRLDPSKDTIVLCHHGVRSMQMSMVSGLRSGGGGGGCWRADCAVPPWRPQHARLL
jgi:rhodanese-related sulfurtransferase